ATGHLRVRMRGPRPAAASCAMDASVGIAAQIPSDVSLAPSRSANPVVIAFPLTPRPVSAEWLCAETPSITEIVMPRRRAAGWISARAGVWLGLGSVAASMAKGPSLAPARDARTRAPCEDPVMRLRAVLVFSLFAAGCGGMSRADLDEPARAARGASLRLV